MRASLSFFRLFSSPSGHRWQYWQFSAFWHPWRLWNHAHGRQAGCPSAAAAPWWRDPIEGGAQVAGGLPPREVASELSSSPPAAKYTVCGRNSACILPKLIGTPYNARVGRSKGPAESNCVQVQGEEFG